MAFKSSTWQIETGNMFQLSRPNSARTMKHVNKWQVWTSIAESYLASIVHRTLNNSPYCTGFTRLHCVHRNRSDFHLCFLQWSVNYEKIASWIEHAWKRPCHCQMGSEQMTNQISEWKAITVSVSLRHQMLDVPSGLIVFVSSELLLIIVWSLSE